MVPAKDGNKLSIKEMLKLLLKVQDYDSQLLELKMRKSFFPDLLKQLQTEIEDMNKELEEKSERAMDIKKEIGLLEMNLQKEKDDLKESNKKLDKVSTNREYDAVQTEIRSHEENIGEFEQRIIVLMDEQETLEREIEEMKDNFNSTGKLNKERIKEIEKNAAEIDSIIEGVRNERENIASVVSKRIIRRYNQIRNGKQGIAVVPIVDRACGGCRQALPPQRIQEIRAGNFVICENCGRIIVDIETMDEE